MPFTITVYTNGDLSQPVKFENAEWKLSKRPGASDSEKNNLFIECNSINDSLDWEFVVDLQIQIGTSSKPCVRQIFTKWDNKVMFTSTMIDSNHNIKLIIDVRIKEFFPTNPGDEFLTVTPNISDAKLTVGDKEFYVCKKILAQSSTYFYDLFYKTHVGKDEFAIDYATPGEFVKFLAFLYNRRMSVSHELHGTLAKLSQRFKSEDCIERCEKILIKFQTMSDDEKLSRAQGFNCDVLHDHVLKNLKTKKEILDLENSPNFSDFGKLTKLKMQDRINEINSPKPYCEHVVTLAKNEREYYVQLGAIPCKIIKNGEKLTISCNWHDVSNPWQCKIIVTSADTSSDAAKLLSSGKISYRKCEELHFDWMNPTQCCLIWLIKVRITVVYLVGIFLERSLDFCAPRENLTDVVLSVGDKKFHVSKQILAEASSYFHFLFFSKFSEKNSSEVELKDIDPTEFEDFLQHIYFPDRNITDRTIDGLFRLSKMLGVPQIRKKCEKSLMYENSINDAMKIYLAEAYGFPELFKTLVSQITTYQHLRRISKLDGFKQISKNTVADITYTLLKAEKTSKNVSKKTKVSDSSTGTTKTIQLVTADERGSIRRFFDKIRRRKI